MIHRCNICSRTDNVPWTFATVRGQFLAQETLCWVCMQWALDSLTLLLDKRP